MDFSVGLGELQVFIINELFFILELVEESDSDIDDDDDDFDDFDDEEEGDDNDQLILFIGILLLIVVQFVVGIDEYFLVVL